MCRWCHAWLHRCTDRRQREDVDPDRSSCGTTLNSLHGSGDVVTAVGSSRNGHGEYRLRHDLGSHVRYAGARGSYALQFPTATNGFGAGFDGLFIRTTNGGNAWKACLASYANHLSPNFNDMHFLNGTTGLAVGSYRVALHKTTNRRAHWSQLYKDTTAAAVTFYGACALVDANLVPYGGSIGPPTVPYYRRPTVVPTGPSRPPLSRKPSAASDSAARSVGAAVGAGRVAVHTTDGGATWSPATFDNVPAARSVSILRKVAFLECDHRDRGGQSR